MNNMQAIATHTLATALSCAVAATLAAQRETLDAAVAETHYRQALVLADALGRRPLQAHCHRGLGTLYATIGQGHQARAEFATAIDMYQSMEMTFWLPQTEAALAQVDAR